MKTLCKGYGKWSALFALALALGLTRCTDLPVQPPAPEEALIGSEPWLVPVGGLLCTAEGATLSSGALYRVCVNPGIWNRDLVVFVPGYHDPASSPRLPDDFADTPASLLFTGLGYAFATTSFRDTGLLEPDTWIASDLLELVTTAKNLLAGTTGRAPRYVYQTGGSQGGLVTVKAVEQYPGIFSGGLAGCGPIGDYRRQINYIGDFRVTFDYFFRDVIEGWPIWTQDLPENPGFVDPSQWEEARARLETALDDPGNWERLRQVINVTGAPIDPGDPISSSRETTRGVLWYSFRGTNDAIQKLNGSPFENMGRVYAGSANDADLNAMAERFHFTADGSRIARLQTSARPARPLVTIHTTGDEIVPVWHQAVYRSRLPFLRRFLHTPVTIARYGHCNFRDEEVLAAFAILVLKVSGQNLFVSSSVLPDPHAQAVFLQRAREHGAEPRIRR